MELKNKKVKRAFKPDSVLSFESGSHSSRLRFTWKLELSTRECVAEATRTGSVLSAYSTLHRVGFSRPSCRQNAGALLPHHFNLACDFRRNPSAVYFLFHFPSGYPARPLAGTPPCDVRTFLSSVVTDRPATAQLSSRVNCWCSRSEINESFPRAENNLGNPWYL